MAVVIELTTASLEIDPEQATRAGEHGRRERESYYTRLGEASESDGREKRLADRFSFPLL
jgi:hypothetical protein